MASLCSFPIKSYKKPRIPRRSKETIYSKVDNEKRLLLLQLVKDNKKSLKEASKLLGINYSTAKTILRVYRIENRILKKTSSPANSSFNHMKNDKEAKLYVSCEEKLLSDSTTETSLLTQSPYSKQLKQENSTGAHDYHSQYITLSHLVQDFFQEALLNESILNLMNFQLDQLVFTLLKA